MSVITTHIVSAPNIMQRLRDRGVVVDVDLVNRRGEMQTYHDMLDYEACNSELTAKWEQEDIEKHKNISGKEYTPDELKRGRYMPLYSSKPDEVSWSLNYLRDDRPSDLIAGQFPDEIMKYRVVTEGHLDGSCYFTDKCSNCTKDGKPIETYLGASVSNKQIKDMGDGTSRVSIPTDFSDKRFAQMYVSNDYIMPADVTSEENNKHYIAFASKSQPVTIYRVDKNGSKVKEDLSIDALKSRMEQCRSDYEKSLVTSIDNIPESCISKVKDSKSERRISLNVDRGDVKPACIYVPSSKIEKQDDGKYSVKFDDNRNDINVYRVTKNGKVKDNMQIKDLVSKVNKAAAPRVYEPSVEADNSIQAENQVETP